MISLHTLCTLEMLHHVDENERERALTTWCNLQKEKQPEQVVTLARDVYLSLSQAQQATSLSDAKRYANRAYASQTKLNKLLKASSPKLSTMFVIVA